MGKIYAAIDDKIQKWVAKQHMFFVATAPRSDDGMVNLSPKGHDTLRMLDNHTLAFMDYGGSGIETIAHLRENGRIVIMMCAFEGPPKIYRFHGRGTVITPLDKEFEQLAMQFDRTALGVRSIVRVDVQRVCESCGFGVPLYDYNTQRDTSPEYIRKIGPEKIRGYLAQMNGQSIDGLPGMTEEESGAYEGPV